jgi:hypothetical protein
MISRETVPELTGRYAFETTHIAPDAKSVRFYSRAISRTLDGQAFAEWPNSTAVRVGGREFVFPRAVRPFTNQIDLEAGIYNAPEDYVSDIPLMERVGEETIYKKTLLRSIPGKVVFEDPRISTLILGPGQDPVILLSFTEYLPKEGKIRNRAVELELGEDGIFLPPKVDENGRPIGIINLSPEGLDAKNGTLYVDDEGQVVLRTRMRGFDLCPNYAEQVWVFKDWKEFLAYQKEWKGWHTDLTEGSKHEDGAIKPNPRRVRPVRAHIAATEASFPEFYPQDQLAIRTPGAKRKNIHESPHFRGFGPGTRPVRIAREGDQLYFSDGKFATQHFAGRIPSELLDTFVVPDGEVRTLTFDHQLRVLHKQVESMKLPRRVYSATLKLWNAGADRIELLYSDAIQPVTPSSRGGGIPDLEHVYPEGWVDVPAESPDAPARLALYAGVADASTERILIDLLALLAEMSGDSPRKKTGQVAPPLV